VKGCSLQPYRVQYFNKKNIDIRFIKDIINLARTFVKNRVKQT